MVTTSTSRRRPRRHRFIAAALSAALLLSVAEASAPPAAVAAAPPPTTAAPQVQSRPDVVSAAVSARAQGTRVEVEELRTATSSTWSNPDGTMTTEEHAAPIRFKDSTGHWRTIDLKWRKDRSGVVAPAGHPLGLKLGRRNAKAQTAFVAAANDSARQVEWLAPWALPDPQLDDTKATYPDVEPGVDLVLHTRRTGFEYDFVVKRKPAAAPVWRIPLQVKGLTVKQQPDGTIDFLDDKGQVHSTIPVPLMWDAAVDERSGEHLNRAQVGISVESANGVTALVVKPDPLWFNDPKRIYPITVDPTYAVGTAYSSLDTWVQSDTTTDQSASPELRLGTYNGGTVKARSFLNFPTAPYKDKQILDAKLFLFETWSQSCTASAFVVKSTQPASTAARWTAQPTIGSQYGSASWAKGHDAGCPAGRVSVPITDLVQAWSTASYATGGMALMGSETDSNSWKRFHSSEGSADPYISYTFNRPPAAPATVEPSEAVAYAAPGETSSVLYSPSLRPWVRTRATDPDGNTVKYVFEFYTGSGPTFSLKGTCTSSVYASGTTAGCRPAMDLPDNTLLYIRAKANDGKLDGPWVSYNQRLRTGAATPAQPVVSCPAPYDVSDTWQDNPPTADVKCTITATGTGYNAPGYLRLIVDGKRPPANFTGGAEGQIKITPSSDPAVAKYDVTFPKGKPGLHTIVVQAQTPAGKLSPNKTHKFGWGGTTMTSPTATPRITTADNVRVTASGPPKGTATSVTAKVKWRVSGYGGNDDLVGWNEATDLPVTDNGAAGVSVNSLWDTKNAKIDANLDADPDTAGVQPTTLNDRVPVKLDVQVCFRYGTTEQCTWSQTPGTTVQRVPHAFGNGFPVSEAGPGQVALWTGEFSTSATDVSVPGYNDDLTLSRSHLTYESPGNAVTGAFGQGWVAQFNGAESATAGLDVVDSSRVDGTVALVDGEGVSLVFQSPSGKRRTTAAFENGTWTPADDDTATDGGKLTITGTGTSTVLSLVQDDGTVTTWSPNAAPTAGAATQFRPTGVSEPGIAGQTTYSYDGNGRVVRVLAPPPPGVTCGAYNAGAPLTGMAAGCRALHFVYTTIGATRVRLSEAWLDTYNPDKAGGAGMESVKVATYAYDVNAQLVKVTDPRSGLATEYTYNGAGDLATIKEPGQVPYQVGYVTVDQRPRVDSVTRQRPAGDPAGGTATVGRFVYDVPLSGEGLPDLTGSSVARWNQKSAPTRGFAVFGPDHPVSGTPSANDWQYADVFYADAAGYTVNTGKFGAGAWQLTSIDYSEQGNAVRQLDERALRAVLDGTLPAGASADQLATLTVYNAEIRNAAGDTVLTPAGTQITDTYAPARFAVLKDGSVAWVRPHQHTTFDQGAPNGGINAETSMPYRLTTTETSYAHDPGTATDLEIISQTLTDYSAPVAGDPDGWKLGSPTRTVVDADLNGVNSAGDLVSTSRYDTEGRLVETRQPASNGADAGTTRTVHYSTAANSSFPACGGKPQWAGLVCQTRPAAQPAAASGATATLPTTVTSAYSSLLAPKTVTETSGPVTRTTTNTYLADGRTESSATTVAGLTGTTANTKKVTTYHAATGLPTVVTAKNADGSTAGTVTTGYDDWGRQISYQPSNEQATTTVYNAAGAVASQTDANGKTTYNYDGTDADGKVERRALPTKVEVTTGGSTWTSTGAYDAGGGLTTQKLPGGITRYNDVDNAGVAVGLRYTGQVTSPNEDGTTTVDPNGSWLSWSLANDADGRVAREWTPDGNAFTSPEGQALGYDRRFGYDNAGHLVQVADRTGTDGAACVTRTYGFDRNGNRTSKATAPAAADGSCSTAGATTQTRAFDTADRPVTGANGAGAYGYDQLGRATTVPASDAPRPSGGDIALAYYGNDLVRSITQGGSSTTFTLDAVDRRSVETVTEGATTTGTVRHYTTPSDNPTWATRDSQTERYVSFLGESLTLIARGGAASTIMLSNPHGDVVATSDVTQPSTVANGLASWTNYDEYGARTSGDSTGLARLGWSGSQGRSEADTGLVLMGRRVYNPATGLFSSIDPIPGGNVNQYAFPTDPVNMSDLDGCKCKFRGKRIHWVIGEQWRSKWSRWWFLSIFLSIRTYGIVQAIRTQSRTMFIIEARCKRGHREHRWAYRYQGRREYLFGVPNVSWLSYTFTSRWGWASGWGAYKWTGDWYRV